MKSGRRSKQVHSLSYDKANYLLFGLAAVVILLGYLALSKGPVDGFMSLSLAPILLTIGYCVIIPLAIMYTKKKGNKDA